jgi:hypothetical protein
VSEDVSDEATAGAQRGRGAHLEVNIPRVGAIDENYGGIAGSDQGGANLNDESGRRIILGIKGERAG